MTMAREGGRAHGRPWRIMHTSNDRELQLDHSTNLTTELNNLMKYFPPSH